MEKEDQTILTSNFINLTQEFKDSYNLMENSDDHIFVTGKAGTGKSTLLKYFKENSKKKVVVLAPTGLSAINVHGQTIHNFFRFPARFIDSVKKVSGKIYNNVETIVIDEVSMVRADLMDGIDKFLRKNRSSNKPFGGVQMIFFGDLFQLPPVVTHADKYIIQKRYNSPYFFSSKVFEKIDFEIIELEEVHRQKEIEFIGVLDKIRTGNVTSEELELINSRQIELSNIKDCIILTPTNRIADSINQQKLEKLPGNPISYHAQMDGAFKYNFPIEEEIKLKVKARVIFVKNDSDGRWVNGTLGHVYELETNLIRIKLDNGDIVSVEKATWDKIEYDYNEEKDEISSEVIGKYKQIPLRLAWALTIHKSQGQSFDNVLIDLATFPWDHGQTYVALSRCRTLEGLLLRRKIVQKDIIVDSRITNFANNKFKIQKRLDEFSHKCTLQFLGFEDSEIEDLFENISAHADGFDENIKLKKDGEVSVSGPSKQTCAFCDYLKDFASTFSKKTNRGVNILFKECHLK